MVNLRVYDQSGTPYYVDLYDTEPVKLNFSIEDITSTDAKSTFSRVFRVPSTTRNNEFFANAFLIEGIDYDVTVKVPAEIEVGGAFFRAGHIRLQNIYVNGEQDRIDYELLFLGETRDFSSLIGEKTLCQLDGSGYSHILNYTSIVQSWQAFPQGPSGIGGLFAGDILYPLVDHGNTYNGSGVAQESQMRTIGTNRFTQNSHPLTPERFKPMIRAKAVIDMIFAQTPYTYSSSFFSSLFFKKMYVSAWGNDSSIYAQTDQTANLCQVTFPGVYGYTGTQFMQVPVYNEVYDPNNNFNPSPFPAPAFAYEAPIAGTYAFTATGLVNAVANPFTGPAFGCVSIYVNGALVQQGVCVTNGVGTALYTAILAPGDYVQMYVQWSANTAFGSSITDASFTCNGAPGQIDPSFLLDCEYKQLDFLRDLLKLFRCVMAPDKDNPNNFIIEPWISYIASGQVYDWSSKVDRTKDFQIEPLFFTQTDEIVFKFSEDEDWLNKYNQDAYKQVYGELIFDSGNELLADSREVTVGFAPTPTIQVEGEANTSSWIIPQPHTHDTEGGQTVHLPIKPVTRILFYNGLQPVPGHTWYMTDGVTTFPQLNYPQVSYQEGGTPGGPLTNGLNINWDRWFAYYGTAVAGYNGLAGQSLFERYWSNYIGSLYNKFARRVTCHIVLNSVDLQEFSFDDVIFIDGVYYIPEKIIDAPIGSKEPVKVQLIKLLDYVPAPVGPPPASYSYYEIAQTNCITVSLPPVVMQSSVPLQAGDYIRVQGKNDCWVVLGPSASTIWTEVFQQEYLDCPTCTGGAPSDYIYFVEQYTDTCPITQAPQITVSTTAPLNIGDTVGLTALPGCWRIMGTSFQVPTDTIATVYINCAGCVGGGPVNYYYTVENCAAPGNFEIVQSASPLVPGQAITLVTIPGCWEVINPVGGSPTVIAANVYDNCMDCSDINPVELYYDLQQCLPPYATTVGEYPFTLTPGMVVRLDALDGCWEVIAQTVTPPLVNIILTYPDCQVCESNPPIQELPVQ
jgi:hypothetical protein